jgi:hypothetical protein
VLTDSQIKKFLTTLHNPRYANSNHTGAIKLTGIFEDQFMTFFASPFDKKQYGRIIYAKAISEAYGKIQEYDSSDTSLG